MGDLLPDMEFNDEEEGEALRPAALRDPGAPSATEIDRTAQHHPHAFQSLVLCVRGRTSSRPSSPSRKCARNQRRARDRL